jgi:hypothetical protein
MSLNEVIGRHILLGVNRRNVLHWNSGNNDYYYEKINKNMSYNIDFKNPDVIRHVFMITFRNEKILFFYLAKKSIMEYLPFW